MNYQARALYASLVIMMVLLFSKRHVFSAQQLVSASTSLHNEDSKMVAHLKHVHPSIELERDLERYFIIDVREHYERIETGFVPTSVHIPLPKIMQEEIKIANGNPILVVCRSGARSRRAAEALISRGHKDVTNLEGGTLAYVDRFFFIQFELTHFP